jgi:hypothetical protein
MTLLAGTWFMVVLLVLGAQSMHSLISGSKKIALQGAPGLQA